MSWDTYCQQTSGAKIFSSHAGAPCTEPFSDTDPELYGVQKSQQARVSLLQRYVRFPIRGRPLIQEGYGYKQPCD